MGNNIYDEYEEALVKAKDRHHHMMAEYSSRLYALLTVLPALDKLDMSGLSKQEKYEMRFLYMIADDALETGLIEYYEDNFMPEDYHEMWKSWENDDL